MKPRSLNAQLLGAILAVIAACWLAVVVIILVHLSLHRTSTWDGRLEAVAIQLLASMPGDSRLESVAGPGLQLREATGEGQQVLASQVWVDRARLVASTPAAPASPLRPDFSDGAASTLVEDRKWRVYSASDRTGRVTVQVGTFQNVVDADMRDEALHLLALATILLLVAGGTMCVVVRRALKPVGALGAVLRHRRSLDLTPLPMERLPRELQVLVASFNHVLQRLEGAIEGERRFIGDAAHELRTPLSALQAQAEIALRAQQPADKEGALRKLLDVARRSTRLSEQLLDWARLNAGTNLPRRVDADLSELAQHVVQEFEVHADQNQRSIYLNVHACMIRCDIDEIGILLRNLVDNAMRYTAVGGKVLVSCGYLSDDRSDSVRQVYLEVADDGLGVPASERDAIFLRFHRVANTFVRGSGVGLSLVARIAELHQARIETDVGLEGRGFKVRIVFAQSSQATAT